MSKEYEEGFNEGMAWCKRLSETAPDAIIRFFPYEKGPSFINGFAEGTITGGRKYNVYWKSREVEGSMNYVTREERQ